MKLGDKVIRNLKNTFFNEAWTTGQYKNEVGVIKNISSDKYFKYFVIWAKSKLAEWYEDYALIRLKEPNDIMKDLV